MEKTRLKKQESISLLADILIKKYALVTFVDPQTNGIIATYRWVKEKGVYEPFFEHDLGRILRSEVEHLELTKPIYRPLLYTYIRTRNAVYKEIQNKSKVVFSPPLRVAFPNATIDWTGRRIRIIRAEDRTPDDYAFNYIPYNIYVDDIVAFLEKEKYITVEKIEEFARAHCPKSLSVFKQWAGDKWVLLYEIIGYTLYPSNEFRKGFLFVGQEGTGRTVFLNLIQYLLGAQNTPFLWIDHLCTQKDKYSRDWLFLSLVNLSPAPIRYKPKDSDKFKKLFGEDYITIYRKYMDPIMFKPYAKLIMASDQLPLWWDKADDTFKSRWIIIESKTQFKRSLDDAWYSETFTEEEMSGILSTAIIAMARVFQKNQFDFEQDISQRICAQGSGWRDAEVTNKIYKNNRKKKE